MLKSHFTRFSRHATVLLVLAAAAACRDSRSPTGVTELLRLGAESKSAVSAPSLETFYGPERFTRGKGAPETFVRDIATAGYIAPFVLHVQSGDASGAGAVSSARVSLDGNMVLGPSVFNAQGGAWAIPVTVSATAHLSVSLASALGSHLDLWLEGQPVALFCPGRAGAYSSLQDAVDAAPDGGTVFVCDGTFTVGNVGLGTKTITIAAAGPGMPTLDAGGLAQVFRISSPSVTSAAITIRGLRLQDASYNNVTVVGNYGSVLIDHDEFHPTHGVPYPGGPLAYSGGVDVGDGAGQGVTVQNSQFIGGDIGVHQRDTGRITILNSTFTNQLNAAIHGGGDQGGMIDAEGNTINGCGPAWCIGVFQGGTVTLVNNHITVDMSRPTMVAIQAGGGTYQINGNVIRGSGGLRQVSDPNTWPIATGMWLNGASADLRGNDISGAYTGLNFGAGLLSGTGTDNTVWDVASAVAAWQAVSVDLHRNDFTTSGPSIQYFNVTGTVSLSCNWWGSPAGPTDPPQYLGAQTYTPWATVPIANSQVTCTP